MIIEKSRTNPWLAWVVIISIVAAGLNGVVGLANGLVSFGQNVGWIAKPGAP